MLAYFDEDEHRRCRTLGRFHPWTEAATDPRSRYYDFCRSPDLIGSVLEDLEHVRGGAAETAIIDFIAWANGSESVFATNDLAVGCLRRNQSGVSSSTLEQSCRVTVLFRELERNLRHRDLAPFAAGVQHALASVDEGFDQACWGWCLWPHLFTTLENRDAVERAGDVIQYTLWAWGDDAEEVHRHMARALANLGTAMSQAYGTIPAQGA